AALDGNSPKSDEPDPESEAKLAPARSKARFTSRSSECWGKTTRSKSFSIPARTRSRSSASARSPPAAETPVVGPHSQLQTERLNSFIVSEASEAVNLSQSAKARGVDIPTSGATSTQSRAGR